MAARALVPLGGRRGVIETAPETSLRVHVQPAGREVLGRGFTLGRRELVEIRRGHRERARARRERPASSDVDAAGGGRTSPILIIGGCDNRERDGGRVHFFSSRVVRTGVSSLVNVERIVSVCTSSLCFLLIRNVDRWRRSASPSRSGGVRARIILPDPSPPLESSSPDDSSPLRSVVLLPAGPRLSPRALFQVPRLAVQSREKFPSHAQRGVHQLRFTPLA